MIKIVKLCVICNSEFTHQNEAVKTCCKSCSYKLRAVTRYQKKHEPIEKICEICQENFLDESKKKLVTKCIQCIKKIGVATRMRKGSYKRSEEQNEKMANTNRVLREAGLLKLTDAGREKMSLSLSEKWKSETFREKVKQGYIKNYGVDHFMKTDFAKEMFSELFKGRSRSDASRQKMRFSAAKRLREGRNKVQFYGKGGFREDLNIYLRSRWEANFARYLKFLKQDFTYESETFLLSDGRTYTPDFKVGEKYYEVKGWWTGIAKEKFSLFLKDYPQVEVQIIDSVEYSRLESEHSRFIEFWEYKKNAFKEHACSTESLCVTAWSRYIFIVRWTRLSIRSY